MHEIKVASSHSTLQKQNVFGVTIVTKGIDGHTLVFIVCRCWTKIHDSLICTSQAVQ